MKPKDALRVLDHFDHALAVPDVLDAGKDVPSEVTPEHWEKLFGRQAKR